MAIDDALLEIRDYTGQGYRPVVDYGQWRVAILNFDPDLRPESIRTVQRHNETDEIFVLLRGRCILFVGDGRENVSDLMAEDLMPLKIYNVKKGVWHTHTLSRDAMVLIVENRDTTLDNSPFFPLNDDLCRRLVDLTRRLWGSGSASNTNP